MPLWKIYHPEGLYSGEDKQALAPRITNIYASIPRSLIYAVTSESVPYGR